MNYKPQPKQKISPHLMALMTYLTLVPLVYFIPPIVGQFLPAIKLLNIAVEVGIIVLIMSYGVMPVAQFFLSRKLSE